MSDTFTKAPQSGEIFDFLGRRDGGAVLLGALKLGVIRLFGFFGLLAAFQRFGRSIVWRSFFGHLALSLGIGTERSFYYEIDTHKLKSIS